MRKNKEGGALVNIAVLALAALLYLALASPGAVAAMAGKTAWPVYRAADNGSVSLQCEVTWEAAAVEPMLDTLRDAGACITFAVSGEWAEAHPELLKRMADEGHEVAVMGYETNSDGSLAFIKSDVERSLKAVEAITGERPLTYCCGSREPSVSAKAGGALGLTTVLCTADLDCSTAEAELILKRLGACASGGSIINIQPTAGLLEALPEIIEYLKNMGLAIVPVHKMLYN